MAPRFLLVLGHELQGRLTPAWPGAGREDRPGVGDGPWVAWRLLGSNHRELARSASVFPTAEAACNAVRELRERLDDLNVLTVATGGRWDWQMVLGDDVVAVASRSYQRPRECAYNLAVTVSAIRAAIVADVSPRIPQPSASEEAIALDKA